jgi:leucine dehydrogenase
MSSLFDSWGGETVVVQYDRPTEAWIIIAIHSSVLGPATGGTRMKRYDGFEDALKDAFRLSAGMTYKYAVSGFERGGGKAVIAIPDDLEGSQRGDLLRRYGAMIQRLRGDFYTGPDVGTTSEDMDVIAETGAPYVFSRTPSAGGAGSSGPFTALSVFSGIEASCENVFGEPLLTGKRVLVQGVGSVGGELIEHLLDAGADVVFSEIDAAAKKRCEEDLGLQWIPVEEVYRTECDVFAPCAFGGILNNDTIPELKCRIVAGGANNQLSDENAAQALSDRGILYVPDYVINVGGAMGITGMEAMGWSLADARKRVISSVKASLRRIFDLASAEGISTEAAARRVAEERLSRGKS